MTTLAIPETLDDIDNEWLSAALGHDVGLAAPPERLSSFACQVARLKLSGGADTPASVIVKLPITGPVRAMIDGIGAYQREVAFYQRLAQEVPLRIPRALVAYLAPESTDFVLILEDLAPLSSPDQLLGLSLEETEISIDEIARFHAWSWESPRLEELAATFPPIDSEVGRAVQAQWGQFFTAGWPTASRLAGDVATDEIRAFADRYPEYVPFFTDQLATPRVLTHGELRADNLILDGADRPYFIDFQNAQQECGPRELAYFLAQSLTTEVRRGNDERLVRRYWDGLVANGVEDYAWEDAWRQYRLGLASVSVVTVLACLRFDGVDARGQRLLGEMVRRVLSAITENDSLALLPDLTATTTTDGSTT